MRNVYGVEAKLSYSTNRLQVQGSLESPAKCLCHVINGRMTATTLMTALQVH